MYGRWGIAESPWGSADCAESCCLDVLYHLRCLVDENGRGRRPLGAGAAGRLATGIISPSEFTCTATCTLFAKLCILQDVCSDSEWELIRKIPNGAAAPDLVSQCSGSVSSSDREWFPIRWGRSLMCVNS